MTACTCHLEKSFAYCEQDVEYGIHGHVIDAECETVAYTNDARYGELVAAALNAYAVANTCIVHRDNPHYPHAPDYPCDECKVKW